MKKTTLATAFLFMAAALVLGASCKHGHAGGGGGGPVYTPAPAGNSSGSGGAGSGTGGTTANSPAPVQTDFIYTLINTIGTPAPLVSDEPFNVNSGIDVSAYDGTALGDSSATVIGWSDGTTIYSPDPATGIITVPSGDITLYAVIGGTQPVVNISGGTLLSESGDFSEYSYIYKNALGIRVDIVPPTTPGVEMSGTVDGTSFDGDYSGMLEPGHHVIAMTASGNYRGTETYTKEIDVYAIPDVAETYTGGTLKSGGTDTNRTYTYDYSTRGDDGISLQAGLSEPVGAMTSSSGIQVQMKVDGDEVGQTGATPVTTNLGMGRHTVQYNFTGDYCIATTITRYIEVRATLSGFTDSCGSGASKINAESSDTKSAYKTDSTVNLSVTPMVPAGKAESFEMEVSLVGYRGARSGDNSGSADHGDAYTIQNLEYGSYRLEVRPVGDYWDSGRFEKTIVIKKKLRSISFGESSSVATKINSESSAARSVYKCDWKRCYNYSGYNFSVSPNNISPSLGSDEQRYFGMKITIDGTVLGSSHGPTSFPYSGASINIGQGSHTLKIESAEDSYFYFEPFEKTVVVKALVPFTDSCTIGSKDTAQSTAEKSVYRYSCLTDQGVTLALTPDAGVPSSFRWKVTWFINNTTDVWRNNSGSGSFTIPYPVKQGTYRLKVESVTDFWIVEYDKIIEVKMKPVKVTPVWLEINCGFDDGPGDDTDEICGALSLGSKKDGVYDWQNLRDFYQTDSHAGRWVGHAFWDVSIFLDSPDDYILFKTEGMYEYDRLGNDDIAEVSVYVKLKELLAGNWETSWPDDVTRDFSFGPTTERTGETEYKLSVISGGINSTGYRVYLKLAEGW